MANGVGLSVGATNLSAVIVDRTAVTRSPVVTLYPHRPAEVGLPGENPNLTERGLVIGDFVDRVGDPVGIIASDGSVHHADELLSQALRAMLAAVTRGQPAGESCTVSYPAHWRSTSVEALRSGLAAIPEFQSPTLISDAAAAMIALQHSPGVPTRGAIALCDFGGSGTSITLVDANSGYEPIGPTVRHTDLSGAMIDQALLSHVVADLSTGSTLDLSSTSAIGSLSRLRAACRGAKERLSTASVTSLAVELPGKSTEVRLTRNELDDLIRGPLADFVDALRDAIDRYGVRPSDLIAVATIGGGARIPTVTTALSEHFRVPVITTPQPELTVAVGAGLKAARSRLDEGMTAMAAAAPATIAAPVPPDVGDDAPRSSTFRALAWSEAGDVPEVAAAAPTGGFTAARPQVTFDHTPAPAPPSKATPWYKLPAVLVAAGALAVFAAIGLGAYEMNQSSSTPKPASTTAPASTPAQAPPPASGEPSPAEEAPQQAPEQEAPRRHTVAPPPQTVTQAPPPPAETSEAPPPPPQTTEAPPPPSSTTDTPPSPSSTASSPTTSTHHGIIPPLPYSTIPGLPFVPAPNQGN
jgi:hypothetical protein